MNKPRYRPARRLRPATPTAPWPQRLRYATGAFDSVYFPHGGGATDETAKREQQFGTLRKHW